MPLVPFPGELSTGSPTFRPVRQGFKGPFLSPEGKGEQAGEEHRRRAVVPGAVFSVPEEGKTAGGELDADLVAPSGFQPDAYQAFVLPGGEDPVGQDGLPYAGPLPFDDENLVWRESLKSRSRISPSGGGQPWQQATYSFRRRPSRIRRENSAADSRFFAKTMTPPTPWSRRWTGKMLPPWSGASRAGRACSLSTPTGLRQTRKSLFSLRTRIMPVFIPSLRNPGKPPYSAGKFSAPRPHRRPGRPD